MMLPVGPPPSSRRSSMETVAPPTGSPLQRARCPRRMHGPVSQARQKPCWDSIQIFSTTARIWSISRTGVPSPAKSSSVRALPRTAVLRK
eukprot:scaffold254559_cov32-Tisochrysis_lutea.AAC.2